MPSTVASAPVSSAPTIRPFPDRAAKAYRPDAVTMAKRPAERGARE